jgi:hypothetical protein
MRENERRWAFRGNVLKSALALFLHVGGAPRFQPKSTGLLPKQTEQTDTFAQVLLGVG